MKAPICGSKFPPKEYPPKIPSSSLPLFLPAKQIGVKDHTRGVLAKGPPMPKLEVSEARVSEVGGVGVVGEVGVVGGVGVVPTADIPFHPVQNQTLRLILNCISDFPGMVPSSDITELVPVLAKILKKHSDGKIGMLEEIFILTCSVVVAIVRTPSVHGNLNLQISIKEAMQHAVLACLSISEKNPCQLLHSLFLLKEAHNHEGNSTDSTEVELRQFIVNVQNICYLGLEPTSVKWMRKLSLEYWKHFI
ncbi:hypothetical protein L3X38_003182 [Prunus dulcis]|uniref:Uncharacterized protein n=1 Tax=Prunus dulcis TaxID=3755 RepID=A0AAD4ZLK5_PRUDU|nr:hypothetical protein L3X38_003182 [Prunus dulcis]